MSENTTEAGLWVQDDLNAHARQSKGKFTAPVLSDFHHRCCAILSRAFRTGVYNLQIKWEKGEYCSGSYPFMVVMVNVGRGLATWDFDHLTRLVIAAHDECVRIDLDPRGPGYMRILMHPRQREGAMATRHPTIEQAIENYRSAGRVAALATSDTGSE